MSVEQAARRFRACFEGSAPALPLALARMALALLVLLRTSDVGRDLVHFNHHNWVDGLEYAPNVDSFREPGLVSPLLPGLSLGTTSTWLLVAVRTLAASLLLLGVGARASAIAVAVAGAWLMAADRFRYLHHLYLLWCMLAWFALLPSAERLSLSRLLLRRPGRHDVPRWSLQLLRLFCASVYFAAGVAKLNQPWLSGDTLRALERVSWVGGAAFSSAVAHLGYAPLAWLICLTELALAPLLLLPRTRPLGVALGILLHLGVVASMEVSTFTGQMLLLLALFLVRDRAEAR